MNDVSADIRSYFRTLLFGNVTFNSANVEVSTKALPDTSYPYVVMKTAGMTDFRTKDKFGATYETTFEIVQRYEKNLGSQDDVDNISNQILGLVPREVENAFTSDTMYINKFTNARTIERDDEHHEYYSKFLTFETYVSEN